MLIAHAYPPSEQAMNFFLGIKLRVELIICSCSDECLSISPNYFTACIGEQSGSDGACIMSVNCDQRLNP